MRTQTSAIIINTHTKHTRIQYTRISWIQDLNERETTWAQHAVRHDESAGPRALGRQHRFAVGGVRQ